MYCLYNVNLMQYCLFSSSTGTRCNVDQTMGYKVGPPFSMPTPSLAWNKPKPRSGGTNKRLQMSVKDSKFSKIVVRNMDHDMMIHDILCGRLEGHVYKQELVVKSFDIGGDGKMSMVAVANYLQDTALTQGERMGIMSDGFSTQEMSRRDLVWVTYKTDIDVHSFPSWRDVIQIQTWIYESGKNGLGVGWIFSDFNTGKPLIQASRLCTMFNMKTRKLSKFIEEARMELKPYLIPKCSLQMDNRRNLQAVNIDTADFTRLNLSPGWNDLDINQHVNNVKYIEWILEGAPSSIMESHQLSSINLEFRKECDKDAMLMSLSRHVKDNPKSNNSTCKNNEGLIELEHSLLLDTGPEVARGRTIWTPKHHKSTTN